MPEITNQAVFLSYAREDTDAVRGMEEALQAAGVEVWFDQQELVGGDVWDVKIRRQISACALFVPVISARSQARLEGYFRIEWKLAAQRTHAMAEAKPFLLPVVIDDTPEAEAHVPIEFRAVQWTRLAQGHSTPQFVERVKRLLEMLRTPLAMREGARGGEAPTTRAKSGFNYWWITVLGVVVLGLLPVVVHFWPAEGVPAAPSGQAASSQPAGAALDPHRIAVMPLDNFSPDAGDVYLAAGMTEELTSSLTKISGLEVIARTSTEQLKRAGKSMADIGKELRTGTLLEGSVRKAGDQLRISVQLIDVASQRHLWSQDYNKEIGDVFQMQADVAQRVAEALKVELLAGELSQLQKRPTNDADAYTFYLMGRYFWNKRSVEDMQKGIALFDKAVDRDPAFALGYVGLADSYAALCTWGALAPREGFAKAKSATMKALELDAGLPEAQTTLAFTLHYFEWNFAGAEQLYERALRLKPSQPTAHHWYAVFLAQMGRFDQALAEARLACNYDPLSPNLQAVEPWFLYLAGKPDAALRILERLVVDHQDFARGHALLGIVRAQMGKYPEAIASLREFARLSGEPLEDPELGYAYALAGNRKEANRIVEALEKAGFSSNISAYDIAAIQGALGEIDQAFTWMERAYDDRSVQMVMLKVDPRLAPLRTDPRYRDLVRRVGFAP